MYANHAVTVVTCLSVQTFSMINRSKAGPSAVLVTFNIFVNRGPKNKMSPFLSSVSYS